MSLVTLAHRHNALHFLAPLAWERRARLWSGVVAILTLWRQRRRTRQQLSTLDDRALADVGLTRAQQRIECSRPFWF
jgi:uncharacterized protein YjiS (DUF1127 family)